MPPECYEMLEFALSRIVVLAAFSKKRLRYDFRICMIECCRLEPWNYRLFEKGFSIAYNPVEEEMKKPAEKRRLAECEDVVLVRQSTESIYELQRYRTAFRELVQAVRDGDVRVMGCKNGRGDRVEIPVQQRSVLCVQHGYPAMLAHLEALLPTVATPRNAAVGYPWDLGVSREMIESALRHEERSDAGPIVWTDLLFSVPDIEKKWANTAGRLSIPLI